MFDFKLYFYVGFTVGNGTPIICCAVRRVVYIAANVLDVTQRSFKASMALHPKHELFLRRR